MEGSYIYIYIWFGESGNKLGVNERKYTNFKKAKIEWKDRAVDLILRNGLGI